VTGPGHVPCTPYRYLVCKGMFMAKHKDPQKPKQQQRSQQSAETQHGETGVASSAQHSETGIGSSQGQDRESPNLPRSDKLQPGQRSDVERGSGESLVNDPTGAYKERP
jgi:hypothetical protein